MVDDHGPTTTTTSQQIHSLHLSDPIDLLAIAHARLPAVLLAEECLGVAQEQHLITLDSINLAPCVHHPAVVARNCRNDIDALLAELGRLLDVRGQVEGLAAGSEGAGHREQDDFLVGPFFRRVVFLGTPAGRGVCVGNGRPSVCLSEQWSTQSA